MSRTFKDFYHYKGFIGHSQDNPRWVKFKHHGEYRKVKYNYKGRTWWFKPPTWFTNLVIVRAERRDNHKKIRDLIKATSFDQLLDAPEFGKGNKPNADWDWT